MKLRFEKETGVEDMYLVYEDAKNTKEVKK